jgi:hypothetical protein
VVRRRRLGHYDRGFARARTAGAARAPCVR